ncbi:MAG: ATP-binding protein [Gammaproteobacteria bacterium]|nr:ATP-binding protein [Gammaproteobacteria bacterium]
MKLGTKLLLVMTPLIVAPLLVLGTVAYFKLQKSVTDNALGQVASEIDHISDHLISDIYAARASIELFSKSPSLQSYLNAIRQGNNEKDGSSKLAAETHSYQSIYPKYNNIKVLSIDGNEIFSFDDKKNTDVHFDISAANILKSQNIDYKDTTAIQIRPESQYYAISFLKQVVSDNVAMALSDRLLGYLSVTMDLSYFKQHVGGKHIESGGDIFFVNRSGEMVFEDSNDYKVEKIRRVLQEGMNITDNTSAADKEWWDESNVYNVRRINENLFLIASLPVDVVNSPGKELGRQIFFTLLVSLFVAGILMAYMLRHYILNPVFSLSKASKAIASGHEATKLSHYYDDELGELANSFNSMSDKVIQSKNDLIKAKIRAENLSRAKTSFIENISHEIRTPLTSIIGFSESLLADDIEVNDREMVIKTIASSGKQLLDVINGILDISVIDSDRLEVDFRSVKLFDIINEAKAFVEMQAVAKSLEFSLEYIFPVPEYITTDAVRVRQVLVNLLSNAVKFTDAGKVAMIVSFDSQANRLFFNVTDTGIGMKQSEIESVFDVFKQLDGSSTRKYGGTGLGLYLAKKLAQQLNGDIVVESQEGEGSKFCFYLSCSNPGALLYRALSKSQQSEGIGSESQHQLAKYQGKVLVAEDLKDNQNLIRLYLERLGLDCDVVENGQLALQAIKQNKYDLVLMDMQMPVMGGLEAVSELRKSNLDLPVVAVTASAMADDVKSYISAGCNDFIAKPIDRVIFSKVIGQYLRTFNADVVKDEVMISSLLQDDAEAGNLVLIFVKKMPVLLQEISDLYQQRLWGELSERVHNLKGTAGNFGFLKVTEVATLIEDLLKDKAYDEIAVQLSILYEMKTSIEAGVTS